ncbi:MAG: aldo/keto reductase, partial [Gemmatimonadaceae bacterium]|nr:aldo/keto reductase [Gloeobacterales cyanobacterium ES-bin-141]
EVLPMARHHDLAILPWGVLGAGTLTGKYSDSASTESTRNRDINDRDRAAGEAVKRIADAWQRSTAQVAINWVRQQAGTVIPILGCRKVYQIENNLGALDFALTPDQLEELNQIFPEGEEFAAERQAIAGTIHQLKACDRLNVLGTVKQELLSICAHQPRTTNPKKGAD